MRRPLLALVAPVVLALVLVPAAAAAQAREPIGQPSPTLTPAIRLGNLVFASGQLPSRGADTTIQAQTTSTLENVKKVLEQAGTTIDQAVKCTVFLVEGTDFQGMNQAYRAFWPQNPPARTTVVVKALVSPGAKLEIECLAAMPATTPAR